MGNDSSVGEVGLRLTQTLSKHSDLPAHCLLLHVVKKKPHSSSCSNAAMELRTVFDSVHGQVFLPHFLWEVIDTPQFQRLRHLKQLGVTNYVFPGATHTRFEHSLGVAHLSYDLICRLQAFQPELNISAEEIKLVATAGLCHDLGHGPLSHAFEVWVNERRQQRYGTTERWCHEEMSGKLLAHLIESNGLDYSDSELQRTISIIRGTPPSEHSGRLFLFDIVNNKRNRYLAPCSQMKH